MSAGNRPSDGPDIPKKNWTNPFSANHPLHDLYGRRVRNHQDLVIIIDDYHSRRGTGKTVASLQLGEGMDQNGGVEWENVSMNPEEIRNAYSNLPTRSSIVLDEGEVGASNRQAMTKSNQALREIMSMGRVEEKYVIINTPSIGFLDKDIRQLADVWMTMTAKGIGLIHYLERQPYAHGASGKLLTPKKGIIRFEDIQRGTRLRDVYNRLTAEKRKHIQGEKSEGFIPESEHREKLQKAKDDVRRETRNEVLRGVYNHPELEDVQAVSQRTLGEAVGLTQQQVGNIVRGENGD